MKLLILLFFILPHLVIWGDSIDSILIWPGDAPGETNGEVPPEKVIPAKNADDVLRISNVSEPTITFFPADPKIANQSAVLVCPGGGYNILAYQHEGTDVCKWLNSFGVTAVLLKYRVPRRNGREKHEAPLQDAQRAMRLIRKDAKELNVNPNKVGILGFSAGGNLAVMASTEFKKKTYPLIDSADELSCRPDFSLLIYPAYLVDRKERKQLFPAIQVTPECPPCFFAHTGDDHVPAEGSALLYLALERAGVIGNELHLYPFGGHGYGMKKSEQMVATWPSRAQDWMNTMGWLKK